MFGNFNLRIWKKKVIDPLARILTLLLLNLHCEEIFKKSLRQCFGGNCEVNFKGVLHEKHLT